MENSTTIALSRLVAQQRALDVTATNIANAASPGFKAQRMLFQEWLQPQTRTGAPPGPRGTAYATDRATYRDQAEGSLHHTGNPLDLAIGDPSGWFTVLTPRGPRLTRAGHFGLSADGGIVDDAGNALLDSAGQTMRVVGSDTQLTVAGDGVLSSDNGQIGRVGVVTVADINKLQAEGDNLYAVQANTTPAARPRISQGALEDSNVQPILEMNRMVNDLREFQFTTQIVQAEADRQSNAIDKIMRKGS